MLISFGGSKLGQKTRARTQRPIRHAHAPASDSQADSAEALLLQPSQPPELGTRLLQWVKSLAESPFQSEVKRINSLEAATKKLNTPSQFLAQTKAFKARLQAGESLDSIRAEAYAVARRAAEVAKNMRPYDCQVAGALAMANGKIAEMMTGEGKTLTATMPLYLNALAGKGAHLVTVNDRLAKRDRDEMAPIFELLGLSVGCALETMSPEEKREGYQSDITYTTDRALGFDFLRDRTARDPAHKLQRPLFFALVDEVDQVLLDEARTPLIISGKGAPPTQDYQVFQEIVEELRPGIEYYVDREDGVAWLTETGADFVQNELHRDTLSYSEPEKIAKYHRRRAAIRAEGNAWKALQEHRGERPNLLHRLINKSWKKQEKTLKQDLIRAEDDSDKLGQDYNLFEADNLHRTRALYASLRANSLFEEGVDYLVQDHRVKIVDENKGRTSRGRRFNDGLHQALEAKSDVPIRPESKPVASITYPNLFDRYQRLTGMSGTAKTSEFEFQELYDLDVVEVPTDLQYSLSPKDPTQARRHNRIDKPDLMFATKQEKFDAVVSEAVKAYEEGVPLLIGTLSVEANEYLYARLLDRGVAPGAVQLLNAEQTRGDKTVENEILANAGRSGLITVATNMAGRGVNVKPDFTNYKKLAMNVERALAGKDGSVTVDVRSEEEAERLSQWLEGTYPYRIGEGKPQSGETLIRVAPNTPFESGHHLKSEDFPTGGLYVIGTERAKSRRIDDQLIGRAARQKAPGQSQFFLSMEDDLFQLHGESDIEADTDTDIEKLVAKVQQKVGLDHFKAREDTTTYDKTLNKQRDAFYAVRDSLLEPNADLQDKVVNDARSYVDRLLEEKLPKRKYGASEAGEVLQMLNSELGTQLVWESSERVRVADLRESLKTQVEDQLQAAFTNLEKKNIPLNEPIRQTMLNIYDEGWSAHLESMQLLKTGVQWAAFAEKDPEIEFNLRGFELFQETFAGMEDHTVRVILPQLFAVTNARLPRAAV